MALSATCLNAQTDSTKFNLLSKRGFYYFPEKGDWSLGINASPFLNYLGNIFGSNTAVYSYNGSYYEYPVSNNAPMFAFTAQNPGAISFKYYTTDLKAVRAKLLFGYTSNKQNIGTGTDDSNEIHMTQEALAIGLYVGQEFYNPIKSRIRGYYGYEVGVFNTPYNGTLSTDEDVYVTGKVEYYDEASSNENFTEKGGNQIGISASGLLGAEWFFSPKISIGGEFGVGLSYAKKIERKFDSDPIDVIFEPAERNFAFKPYASGDLILHIYF